MATASLPSSSDDDNILHVRSLRQPLLISVEEVSDLLGISVRSVWRLHSSHQIPEPVRLAGSVRWRLSEVRDWVDAGCPPLDNGKPRPSK